MCSERKPLCFFYKFSLRVTMLEAVWGHVPPHGGGSTTMGRTEAQIPWKSETRKTQRWNEAADHIIWDLKDPQALLISEFPNYMNSFPSLFKIALFELFSFVNEMKVLNSTDTYRKYSYFFFLNIKIMPPPKLLLIMIALYLQHYEGR